jgi:hypothetical protein
MLQRQSEQQVKPSREGRTLARLVLAVDDGDIGLAAAGTKVQTVLSEATVSDQVEMA